MQGIIKATLLLLSFSSLACSQIEGHSKWSDLFLIFCGWQINDTQSKRCWADMLYLIGCKRVQYDIWRHDNADWRLVQMHFFGKAYKDDPRAYKPPMTYPSGSSLKPRTSPWRSRQSRGLFLRFRSTPRNCTVYNNDREENWSKNGLCGAVY